MVTRILQVSDRLDHLHEGSRSGNVWKVKGRGIVRVSVAAHLANYNAKGVGRGWGDLDRILGFFFIVAIFGIRWMYTMVLNDRATGWLGDNYDQINHFLEGLGLTFNSFDVGSNTAPCDVYFGLHEFDDEPRYLLSSHEMKEVLLNLQRGEIRARTALAQCESVGNLRHKYKETDWSNA